MKNYNKVLITGGAKRIGASIVKNLAKQGLDIAIQYNNSTEEVRHLEEEISRHKINFESFKFDFNKKQKIEKLFNVIERKIGTIDFLINNASAFEFDTIKKTSYESFDKHINVNLRAPYFLINNFVRRLGKKKGLIINILDQRVKNITPYFSSYTLSKSALYTLTKSSSIFLAPKIRVNGISPGPTLKSKNQTNNQFKSQILRTPLKKRVELYEINNAIDYLMNNLSVTGEVLTIDGGQSLGWANSKSKVFTTD